MVTKIAENVYWVGVVDWSLSHFHGHEFSTHRGSTYNTYLITDEKTVLVDTVWGPFQDQLIENIKEIIDPASIDYILLQIMPRLTTRDLFRQCYGMRRMPKSSYPSVVKKVFKGIFITHGTFDLWKPVIHSK